MGAALEGRRRAALAISVAACGAALAVLGWRMWDGLTFLAFSDEAAQVLGGRVLLSGGRLYRDFVDSHGPLIFALAQIYGALFGWSHTNGVRFVNILFAAAAFWSVAAAPVLERAVGRMWAAAVMAGLLASVWLVQGLFMFNYYPVSGALAAIGLAGFGLAQAGRGRAHAALGGIACALLVASAYAYAPTVVCFAAAGAWGCRRGRDWRTLAAFAAGLSAGLLALLAYLCVFGDVRGYLAFHFAENQFVYSHYIGFSAFQFERSLQMSGRKQDVVQSFGVVWALAGCALLQLRAVLRGEGARWLPQIVLVLTGVFLLNARGSTQFQDGTFLFASIAVFAVASASLVGEARGFAWAWPACLAALVVVCDVRLARARYTPFNLNRRELAAYHRWPIGDRSELDFFKRVRAYAGPFGHMLSLTYAPGLYLAADVAPMDGFYTYFRWDADYAKAPWFGRGHDLCAALARDPPEVIFDDHYPVWGYAPQSYMPCVDVLLAKDYVANPSGERGPAPLFVRRDRLK